MSFPAVWSHTTHDLPFDDAQFDAIRCELDEQMRRWCDRYGYEAVGHRWSVDTETFTPSGELIARPVIVSATVRMTVTLRARTDGVWGSVRAALAEDGLLDPRDLPEALEPDPPWHRPARVGPWPGGAGGATVGTGGGAGGSTGAVVTGVDIARDGRPFITYRCPNCEAVCLTETSLRGHRRSAHGHGIW